MSKHYKTAPEDRVSFPRKLAYGAGAFVNNVLAAAIGGMNVLLILILGMDPRLVGILGSLPRLTDALTDPVMGFVSDRTRSRWGRRRPYLFIGAIASGVLFALLWQMPAPSQLRVKLVDYGPDGVYSGGETGADLGFSERVAGWARGLVAPDASDDAEHEIVVTPPTLVTGAWMSLDIPLSDFTDLTTREHLAQILISGDLEEVYLDNVYLYGSGDGEAAAQALEAPAPRDGQPGRNAPAAPAPAPPHPVPAVISFFSDAYDDVPVGHWSTDWDRAEVEDVQVAGNAAKRYSDLRFAAIDFGDEPVDASRMTYIRMDIWTPNAISEGRSATYYFWWFLIGSIIFFLAYTVFATPWVALGYELTPDYHERTRLMGVQNFIGNIPYLIAPFFVAIALNPAWFRNQMAGAGWLAIAVGATAIALGVIPALFLRERIQPSAAPEGNLRSNIADFGRGLMQTIKCKPFLMLCIATFLIFNSFIMIASFQIWVFIHYVYGGNAVDGAWLAGLSGLTGQLFGFAVIAFVTWLGTKVGKRHALVVSTTVSIVGYGMKWFFYTPEHPMLALLPAPFMAFGLGGLFTLMGSMVADVVDLDELSTGERREGLFGSIYWWVIKLGQSLAILLSGYLLVATGFDATPGAVQTEQTLTLLRLFDVLVPLTASAVAVLVILKFPITEGRAREIRQELERRRAA